MEEAEELGSVFDWVEYSVFGCTLFLSVLIGIYHGFVSKRGQNSAQGYILGNRQITLLPMAVSLVASFISGIALLGLGAETYVYGTQYLTTNFAMIFVGYVNAYLLLPIFYKMQVVSVYEYLEVRFDHRIRKAGSILFAFYLIVYLPIVIYVPALALNQVANIDVHLITPIVCGVCIFYTSVGGLKAVVWTDLLQTSIMVVAMLLVVFIGLDSAGGWTEVATIVQKGERWEWFNMDPSPSTRITFWSAFFGMMAHFIGETGVNPSFVQRLVALKSEKTAKKAVLILVVGSIFFRTLAGLVGLLAYAKYHGCDPVSTKVVRKSDQITPYFVLDVAKHIRGLPGIYMSGIFAAALSTMSGGLNTIAATIYKDLMLPHFKTPPSDEKAGKIMKMISLTFGIVCVVLIFLVEKLGSILEMSVSLCGSSSGLLFGVFVLGIFVPCGNSKGAAWGLSVGAVVMTWMVTGNRIARMNGLLEDPIKPMSVESCTTLANSTDIYGRNHHPAADVFPLYKMTVLYHSLTVFLTTLVVGLAVSYFTGGNKDSSIDPNLFSPWVQGFIKRRKEPSTGLNPKIDYNVVPLTEVKNDVPP